MPSTVIPSTKYKDLLTNYYVCMKRPWLVCKLVAGERACIAGPQSLDCRHINRCEHNTGDNPSNGSLAVMSHVLYFSSKTVVSSYEALHLLSSSIPLHLVALHISRVKRNPFDDCGQYVFSALAFLSLI